MSSPNRNELASIDDIAEEGLNAEPSTTEQETPKRKLSSEGAKDDDETDDESSPKKRIKSEDDIKVKEEPSDDEAMPVPIKTEAETSAPNAVKIKAEPADGDDGVPAAASTSGSCSVRVEPANSGSTPAAVVVKTEPATSNGQPDNDAPVVSSSSTRISCRFGIRCYRRNPAHRNAEAHPGDTDYTRPNFPAPPLGTPPCPFGNLCYRRNPVHFQQLAHPADFNSAQNIRNRLRQRQTRVQQAGATEDSDEEEEDPFGGDNDDDLEYKPGADIDEDEDEEDELEFDSQRILADDYD
ncbi:aprataxin and PNK-like factor [Drosophila guanche]|uniref:Blast:Aprataxin and PNK-like factor n=1 Tax=Drosophila guanche TaxID=7266 RepID=A0A3B0K548_DROGU|nr:aprataxin and PNK-like factor [Drosophila guanche]SPP80746.1 blast:Aprataxin and PNK-like factor [Drosophila guanche]